MNLESMVGVSLVVVALLRPGAFEESMAVAVDILAVPV